MQIIDLFIIQLLTRKTMTTTLVSSALILTLALTPRGQQTSNQMPENPKFSNSNIELFRRFSFAFRMRVENIESNENSATSMEFTRPALNYVCSLYEKNGMQIMWT